ncbi:hypothetical protein BASA83_004817 [Batrachochytrium salamandrivorans]|nr:hypothetical protein BASA83_004817 [Batrachochytrium salamandrivorans]
MCTATLTDDTTRSPLGEFSSRIQKRAPPKEETPKEKTPKEETPKEKTPKEKMPRFGPDDEQYDRLKAEYKEANQDTHTKCAAYKKAKSECRDAVVNKELKKSGMMTGTSYRVSQRGTRHPQFSSLAEQIKNVKRLRQICKDAKTLEAQVKSELRKHEEENKYDKSQKYEKYKFKAAMKKLEDEAKQNEEA